MIEPTLTPNSSAKTVARRRSPIERAIVWGGILFLLLVLWMEWQSMNGYQATFENVDAALDRGTFPTESLSKYVQGFALRSRSQRDKDQLLTLWWPSLVRSYRLRMRVEGNTKIGSIDTSGMELDQETVTVPPIPSPTGFPDGYGNVLALKLAERTNSATLKGPLAAELVHQGFLIAAEHELGLATLDPSVGDVIPDGKKPGTAFALTVIDQRDGKEFSLQIVLAPLSPAAHTEGWPVKPLRVPEDNWLEALVTEAESASRDSFVEALQKAGYKKVIAEKDSKAELALVEDRLDCISQFVRIRQLHRRMRAVGETPELLGDLIRAYANLGSLCDFHWSASSRVFKARALLYARRLVVKTGETPFALAHCAYAWALTGCHATALTTVATAKTANGVAAPDWLELIDDYCAHRPAELDQVTGVHKELAHYLCMRMTDRSSDEVRALTVTNRYLAVNPACCRAVDWLAEMPGLGIRRLTIEAGFSRLWPELYGRLDAIPDLPAEVKRLAKTAMKAGRGDRQEYASRIELMRLLRQEASRDKDAAGPSWGVLAELIHDVTFVQAWRVLMLENQSLGIDADPSLQLLRPLVKDHRLGKFLEVFGRDRQNARNALGAMMASLEWNRMTVNALYICARAGELLPGDLAGRATQRAMDLADPIYEDVARVNANWPGYHKTYNLFDISPDWPQSAALSIANNWDKVKANARAWEDKFQNDPCVLNQLAWKYIDEQPDDAIRCIQRSIKVVPTIASHRVLAEIYKRQGESDLWRKTLTAALKLPSYGLEDNNLHVELAYDQMRLNKWKKAWVHATAAAQSYSATGLQTAARAAEGLQDWQNAEDYVQKRSERYKSAGGDWYFWCVRTGRGNKAQAKLVAEQTWKSLDRASATQMWRFATMLMLTGNLTQARAIFESTGRQHDNQAALTFAAVLADLQDDIQARDRLFKLIAGKLHQGNAYTQFTNLLQCFLSGSEQNRWNLHNFEHIVVMHEASEVTYLNYLAGVFLIHHGQPALGLEYLKQAASSFDVYSLACVLAADALHNQNVAVPPTRLNELPDEIAGPAQILRRAITAQEQHKPERALALFNQVLEMKPDFLPGLNARGDFYFELEQHADAIADYEAAIALDPGSYISHLNLAWILACGESAEHRNGEKALIHAERAASLRQFKTWTSEVVLAAAHAECGHFEKAIEHEKRAQSLPQCDLSQPRLAAYSKGEPYHKVSKKQPVSASPAP